MVSLQLNWIHSPLSVGFFVTGVVTFLIFLTFVYQCIRYKKRKDGLSTTYSILTTIGFFFTLGNCITTFANVYQYDENPHTIPYACLLSLRVITILLHCLFFIWRLQLTFTKSAFALSNGTLICYHIFVILMFIICSTEVGFLFDNKIYNYYSYFFITCETFRVIMFCFVSFQFVTKLLKLIVMQHRRVSISKPGLNTTTIIIKNNYDKIENEYQNQNENEIGFENNNDNETIESMLAISNDPIINFVTKLTILVIFDCLFVIIYSTIVVYRFFDIKSKIMDNIHWIALIPYFLATQLTVWLSFKFSDKQYKRLFYCCHRHGMRFCMRIAWSRIKYARRTTQHNSYEAM